MSNNESGPLCKHQQMRRINRDKFWLPKFVNCFETFPFCNPIITEIGIIITIICNGKWRKICPKYSEICLKYSAKNKIVCEFYNIENFYGAIYSETNAQNRKSAFYRLFHLTFNN